MLFRQIRIRFNKLHSGKSWQNGVFHSVVLLQVKLYPESGIPDTSDKNSNPSQSVRNTRIMNRSQENKIQTNQTRENVIHSHTKHSHDSNLLCILYGIKYSHQQSNRISCPSTQLIANVCTLSTTPGFFKGKKKAWFCRLSLGEKSLLIN